MRKQLVAILLLAAFFAGISTGVAFMRATSPSPQSGGDQSGVNPSPRVREQTRVNPSPHVRKLIELAHSGGRTTREKAVGELLSHLEPGMSHEQVEEWIGLPEKIRRGGVVGEDGTIYRAIYGLYYC